MIFVSTSCLEGVKDLAEVLDIYSSHGIENVELGSCHEYIEDVESTLREYSDLNFVVHNYFPPAREPFIMNLAAQDGRVRTDSIAVCKRAIDLCHKFSYDLYSFHPGFRVKETLGLKFDLTSNQIVPYEAAFEKFTASLEEISTYAESRGVKVALENLEHQNQAYMMTRPEEFERVLDLFPELGVLLDMGHLKIASRKFGFAMEDFIKRVGNNIAAVHIHENDGEKDLHLEPMGGDLVGYLSSINSDLIVLEGRFMDANRIAANVKFLEGKMKA